MEKGKIRTHVFIIAIPLIAANSSWLNANWGAGGYVTGQSFPTIVSLYFNAIFALTVLIGVNFCLRQFSARLAFSNAELLALYIMLVVASAVTGHDALQILWPMVTYPIWFSTPENEWAIFHPYIPDWLTIKDKGSLTSFSQVTLDIALLRSEDVERNRILLTSHRIYYRTHYSFA